MLHLVHLEAGEHRAGHIVTRASVLSDTLVSMESGAVNLQTLQVTENPDLEAVFSTRNTIDS